MSASDGEEEERKRQERERSRMSFLERLYGSEFRTTASGFTDGRSLKRTGRVIQATAARPSTHQGDADGNRRVRHPDLVGQDGGVCRLLQIKSDSR